MGLSDISILRPVFASVISLLLIAFGIVSFSRLPLREFPDIDPPVVSINTSYSGASASVVEAKVTQVIENRISGVEGIKYISSSSEDGRSRISIEFDVGRDIDGAANDVRDRVSGILNNLPEEADPPEVQKVDTSDDVILWMNLTSDRMNLLELTDYARRTLEDRFSILPGVASVRIGGAQEYSMRVWLDRTKMAARGLTVNDVEDALRTENVEFPAGSIESIDRQFTARIQRNYQTADDFKKLIIARGENNYLVRLADIARVEKAAVETRTMFRGNGVPMIGIGIIKQSKANTIGVVDAAKAEVERIKPYLPEGVKIIESYDTSVFIKNAVKEVYITLAIAIGLVILVIYMFLGSVRATLIPAVAVPVSIISTFILLYMFGFSINLLTLLALVLAIGLVVDDAIVVLENIYRRVEEGEKALHASFYGTRQVFFAVVATTAVLVSVFAPITFLEGDLGRLFSEFALTMAAAVGFSGLVALTLCPMLASKILRKSEKNSFNEKIDRTFSAFQKGYERVLSKVLKVPALSMLVLAGLLTSCALLYMIIPTEYAPKEDRGAFFVNVNAPEGTSFQSIKKTMDEVEKRLTPFIEKGEIYRILVRAPRSFGSTQNYSGGSATVVLADWSERRPAAKIMDDVRKALADMTDVRVSTVMRQGFGGGGASKPVQFVLGGGTYEELAQWRDILMAKINENNPGLVGVDFDYKETKPQLRITIDRDRAGDLGVSISNIGRTLETMLGGRRVTTFLDDGEEYDVILEGERSTQRSPNDMQNIYVRSDRSGEMIPLSSVVTLSDFADSNTLNRYNRIRSITIDAGLAENLTVGEALDYLEKLVRENLPESAVIDYKGESLNYKRSGGSIFFVFALGLLVVFLVLAAQFESYIHPFVIILTVPLAISGGLLGILVTGGTLNVYTQVGLIMLVGLATKNGILIVEFINQLRDKGVEFKAAIIEGSSLRLRPILMTSITAVAGAVPLILSHGAGSETRAAIGVVIFFGVLAATIFTIFIVPAAYSLVARNTGTPNDTKRRLEQEEREHQEAAV